MISRWLLLLALVWTLIRRAWVSPTIRTTGDLITASIYNTDIIGNLLALKSPPSATTDLNEVADYMTTSTTFASIDATDLSKSINTKGGDVLVTFVGSVQVSNSVAAQHGSVFFDLLVDGVREGLNDGLFGVCSQNSTQIGGNCSFPYWVRGLAAGNHTFELQWKVMAAAGTTTATLFAGAGTSQGDVHPSFDVREAS